MRKIISILLALIMMFGCISAVQAESSDWDEIIFELGSMGIVDKDADINSPVTRGEFAKMVTNLLGMGAVVSWGNINYSFTDVLRDASYAPSVALLSSMGIMNGFSETTFAPNESVTIQQAVKVMVVCTGYDFLAVENGGWPYGYNSIGASIGILKDVDMSSENSRAEIYRVIYNTLDVRLIKEELGSGDIVKTNTTLRDNYRGVNNKELYYLDGVVDGNYFSYASAPAADLAKDEVVIDSVIYKIGDTDAFNLVGHHVNFFAYKDGKRYVIHSIMPDSNEKVSRIASEDVIERDGQTLRYLDGDKEKRFNLHPRVKVVYNGIRIIDPADSIWSDDIGTITLIDHEGNGSIDVAMIDRYESYIVNKYKDGLFMFNDATLYNGKNSFYIDPDRTDRQFVIIDTEGKEVAEFEDKRVVSIFVDDYTSRYKFVVSDLKTSGALNEINDDGWKIDDEFFSPENPLAISGELGKNYEAYLNFNKEIVYISEKTEDNYAYILDIGRESDFSNTKARILHAGDVDFGVDVNADNVDDANQVPFLIAQNKAIAEIDFADKVNVNGTSCRGDSILSAATALKNTAVTYALNADGKISAITSLAKYAGSKNDGEQLKYNVYEMVFGGKEEAIVPGFAINADTKVICVPEGSSYTDEDALSKVKVDVATNEVGYKAVAYEFDEITKRAKLLVMHSAMRAAEYREANINSSRTSIVSDIKKKYDPVTGEAVTSIDILQDGELKTFIPIDNSVVQAKADSLAPGDVISYVTNANDRIADVMIICRAQDFLLDDFKDNGRLTYKYHYGPISNIVTDEVDSLNYIMVTLLDVNVDGSTYTYSIPQRNKPPVYIYYKNRKQVEAGSLSDIIPDGDKAYILQTTGTSKTIKAVVIVR